MKPAAILKFIVKLLLLEAFVVLVIDALLLGINNESGRRLLLIPVGTLLYFVMTAPISMLIYILLRIDYGYNNKNLLHALHAVLFVAILFAYTSDRSGGDKLLFYIPGAAVIIATGVVIYMESPNTPT